MIYKIGLAVIRKKRLLLVKKKGLEDLILPGGKPEKGETRIGALKRELLEELKVIVDSARYVGFFEDVAAGKNETVRIFLYLGELKGKPRPSAEISGIKWYGLKSRLLLSPVLKNKIVPFFVKKDLM